jgi:hypothetical protein
VCHFLTLVSVVPFETRQQAQSYHRPRVAVMWYRMLMTWRETIPCDVVVATVAVAGDVYGQDVDGIESYSDDY